MMADRPRNGSVRSLWRISVFAILLLCLAPVAYATDPASTTYQIDSAHDGGIAFSTPLRPPLKVHWSVELGGAVSYPVVAGDLVIVLAGGAVGTHIAALNATTGKIVWQKLVSGDIAEFHLAYDSGTLFLAADSAPLQAFNAANGKALWSATGLAGGSDQNIVPVAANGSVYVGGDYEGYRVTERTGFIDWTHKFFLTSGVAVLGDGKLFFANACETVALAPGSGRIVWDKRQNCENYANLPSAYYNGRVYVGAPRVDDSGLILNATTGRLIGSLQGYPPAFSGNTSYSISKSSLIAAYVGSGNLRWSFTPKDGMLNPPIVVNNFVYALSPTGNLYVARATDGHLAQTIKLGLGTESALAAAPGTGLGAGQNLVFVPSGSKLTAVGK